MNLVTKFFKGFSLRVINDGKEKLQSFETTLNFETSHGVRFEHTSYGRDVDESRENMILALRDLQIRLYKVVTELEIYDDSLRRPG